MDLTSRFVEFDRSNPWVLLACSLCLSLAILLHRWLCFFNRSFVASGQGGEYSECGEGGADKEGGVETAHKGLLQRVDTGERKMLALRR